MPDSAAQKDAPKKGQGPSLRFAGRRIALPASRVFRVLLGIGLCIGGIFSFLPVLGLWMLPLGILVLSIDLHPVRRLRRRFDVHWGRSEMREHTDGWFAWLRAKIKRQ